MKQTSENERKKDAARKKEARDKKKRQDEQARTNAGMEKQRVVSKGMEENAIRVEGEFSFEKFQSAKFPIRVQQFFEAALEILTIEKEEEFRLAYDSHEIARNFRLQLYPFIKQLAKEFPRHSEERKREISMIQAMTIKLQGKELITVMKDRDPATDSIQETLDEILNRKTNRMIEAKIKEAESLINQTQENKQVHVPPEILEKDKLQEDTYYKPFGSGKENVPRGSIVENIEKFQRDVPLAAVKTDASTAPELGARLKTNPELVWIGTKYKHEDSPQAQLVLKKLQQQGNVQEQ